MLLFSGRGCNNIMPVTHRARLFQVMAGYHGLSAFMKADIFSKARVEMV